MDLKSSYISGFETRRDFLRIRGSDALRFLQGMWTSDLKLAASQAPAVMASYLLSVKGRPVSPAQILCIDEKDFLLSLPEGMATKTSEALDRYIVADDVELEVESGWQTWTLFDEEAVEKFRLDPRVQKDASKVFRAFSLSEERGWLLPIGQWTAGHQEVWLKDASHLPTFPTLNVDEQTKLRIDAGLPEWARDITEESLILEYPFAQEISFHKGCYIGQEVVARGTYRGQVPRAFARFQADAPLKEGGFIYRSEDTTKAVGKMTSTQGPRALGQIRLRDFEGASFVAESAAGVLVPLLSIRLLHSKVTE